MKRRYRSAFAMTLMTLPVVSLALTLPDSVNCYFDGKLHVEGGWKEGADTLVEVTQREGAIRLTTREGVFSYEVYARFNGMTTLVCPNALDLRLGTTQDCLSLSAPPRRYKEGVSVSGKIGNLWEGVLWCELPMT